MREFIPKKLIPEKYPVLSESDSQLMEALPQRALQISAEELDVLRERIKKVHGLVRCLVHPFYLGHDKENRGDARKSLYKAADFVEDGALRHISSAVSEGSSPVFLFEEGRRLNKVKNELSPIDSPGVFMIPTEDMNGTIERTYATEALDGFSGMKQIRAETLLQLNNDFKIHVENLERETALLSNDKLADPSLVAMYQKKVDEIKKNIQDKKYFDKRLVSEYFLGVLFRSLKVKKIIIGGMYLSDKQDGVYGCVADVVYAAKKLNIKIALSKYHMDWDGSDTQNRQLPHNE